MNDDQNLFFEEEIPESFYETEQTTLLDAFIFLTRNKKYEDHPFSGNNSMMLDTTDNAALRYLMRRLEMNPQQVQILTCVLFHCQRSCSSCDMDDLNEYMGAHPLSLLSKQAEFARLTDTGYLEEEKGRGGFIGWRIRKEALEAIKNNQPFDINTIRATDSLSLLTMCAIAIREGDRYDMSGEIKKKLHWLFRVNPDLLIVKNILRAAGDDDLRFVLLVLAAALVGAEEEKCVDYNDMTMVMSGMDARKTLKSLQRGTHPYVQWKLFEPYCSDGMAKADYWVISRQGWLNLLGQNVEEVDTILRASEEGGRQLVSCKDIKERKLFFSGKTKDEVNRLRELLQDDQYRQVVARLKEKNMPTGLNVLLYGTPGTGKTELVQQLARETGRDIFSVDMSQIRDKWVGQSEQNLAQIFNTYRAYVSRMKVTPILFCNECDAIFGSRLERTTQSVDKMENAMQNILLEQMEKMQGIMICTTNLTSTLDKAFERRFLLKIQMPKPGQEARKQIWESMLPNLTDEQADTLATRFDFSGGQIQNVTRKQIINSIFSGNDGMDFQRILDDCTAETMDRSNGHKIGFNG